MPYITNQQRKDMKAGFQPTTPGQLNYNITMMCQQYLASGGESYQAYNDILGALEGCKLELYRRKVAGYEDKKIVENGEVYV